MHKCAWNIKKKKTDSNEQLKVCIYSCTYMPSLAQLILFLYIYIFMNYFLDTGGILCKHLSVTDIVLSFSQ